MKRANALFEALIRDVISEGGRYTDKQIAEMIGCKPSRFSAWINGKVELEPVEFLLRLLDRLPEEKWLQRIKVAIKHERLEAPSRIKRKRKKSSKQKTIKFPLHSIA